jgi:preprotein translocase subunit SecF
MFSLIPKTNIDFVGARRIGFAFSAVLTLLGLYSILLLAQGKAKLGVDFGGGANVTLQLKQNVEVDALRKALGSAFNEADIQAVQGSNTYLIRLPLDGEATDAAVAKAKLSIPQALPGNEITDVSEEYVGPAVSRQLWHQALWAMVVSMAGILIYIAFRFDFRFGIGAMLATLHDVLAVLGLMIIFRQEFSLLVVTALLTLAGYSLTDTVVVFDRIRENLKARRSDPMGKVVNDSINETLSRTINTSMTVMLVVVVLYFFGGDVVHSFSLALILGVLVGTYSSIFVASPLVVEWNLRSPARR